MAIKKEIELELDLKKAVKDIEDIREQFVELQQSVKDVEAQGKKTSGAIKKGFKGLKGVIKKVGNGFKGLGLALKAIPVMILVEAFNVFKQVLGENQAVSDAFAIAFGTVSNLFNDFVNFLVNNWKKAAAPVTKFFESKMFENINKIFLDLVTRVKNLVLGIGGLGAALFKVFKGDFKGASESAKDALENLGQAVTGSMVENAKLEVAVKKVATAIKEKTKEAYEGAKDETVLANAAKLAAAEQERLRLVNLKAAEEQRQIRDDISQDIDARIEANKKLGKIIEDGIKQELVLAQKQLDAADAALANNSTNIDLQAEQIRATALLLEIEERLGGQRSEQIVNETGLLQEKLDLENSISQGESDTILKQLEGQAAIEDGILDRLDLERQVAAEQQRIAEEQFENTKAIFEEGTIQYKEAEKAKIAATQNAADVNVKIKKQEEEAKLAIVSGALGGIQSLLGETSVAGKAAAVAQSIINTYQGMTKALGQGGIFGPIAAAGVLASGLASVKKIVSTKIPNANDNVGGGGMSAATPVSQAPSFNIVGSSPINQIADTLNNQKPVKAYVVSGDVTSAQQLDRNIISESGI